MSIVAARVGSPTLGAPGAPDGENPEANDGRGAEPSGSMTRVAAGCKDAPPARLADEPNGFEAAPAGERVDDSAAIVATASPRAVLPEVPPSGPAMRITLGAVETTLDADGAPVARAESLGAAPKKLPPEPVGRTDESNGAPEVEAVRHAGDAGTLTVGAGGMLAST